MVDGQAFQSTTDPAAAAHHRYDILVVGAGPAGSSAAYHLARQRPICCLSIVLHFLVKVAVNDEHGVANEG